MTLRARTSIVLTGFSPFPTQPVNATAFLVPELAARARRAFPDVRIHDEVLATEWHGATRRIEQVLAEIEPDIALFFGISGRARGFEIETRALNRRKATADAAGVALSRGPLIDGGPDVLPASLPAVEIVRRLRLQAIPAAISRDAGGYICNALLYHALLVAPAIASIQRIGFVHLPADLAVPGRRRTEVHNSCALGWEMAAAGGLEIIAACLGRHLHPGHHRARKAGRGLRHR